MSTFTSALPGVEVSSATEVSDAAEHECGPRGAVNCAWVDLAGPTIGIGHAQEPGERFGAGTDPSIGVDEVGLHVDDGMHTPEGSLGFVEIVRGRRGTA